MIEDKLTHPERVRLEALNIAASNCLGSGDSEHVLRTAATYEKFILGDQEEGKESE